MDQKRKAGLICPKTYLGVHKIRKRPDVQVAVATSSNDAEDLEDCITAAKIIRTDPTTRTVHQQMSAPKLAGAHAPSDSDRNKFVRLNTGRVMTLTNYRRLVRGQAPLNTQTTPQINTPPPLLMIRSMASVRARAPRFPTSTVAYTTPPRPAIRRGVMASPQQLVGQSPVYVPPEQQQQQQSDQMQQPQVLHAQPPPEGRERASMLVISQNGEQRLIMFTLPKESCTVQELLEQVGVQFEPDTNIKCIQSPGANIDYLVTVGVHFNESPSEIIKAAESSMKQIMKLQLQQQQQEKELRLQQQQQQTQQISQNANIVSTATSKSIVTPVKQGGPPPRYISISLCPACGFRSTNHTQCQRCRRIFTEDPKKIPIKLLMTTPPPKAVAVDATNMVPNGIVRGAESSIHSEQQTHTSESTRDDDPDKVSVTEGFACTFERARAAFLGTYEFTPRKEVLFTVCGIHICVPHTKRIGEWVTLNIRKHEIVRLVYHFSDECAVLFLNVADSFAESVRDEIEMESKVKCGYFNSSSEISAEKKITIQLDPPARIVKSLIKTVFPSSVRESIKLGKAQSLLDELTKSVAALGVADSSYEADANGIRKILVYPPSGKGGISINTEDYKSLAIGQCPNDIIIDFGLKYVLLELLTEEQREKTHVFSSFFYQRLTTFDTRARADKDVEMTAAQEAHDRVKTWTKNVNLFEKDFIIIPINEESHWFLAIICFPAHERHAMNDNNLLTPTTASFKHPCILIFDSLAGASRSIVLATLRDYLTCEYQVRIAELKDHKFDELNMPGHIVKVPQQTNSKDSGLYLLQYVQQFFEDPIKDYRLPIQGLINWFDNSDVTRKRKEISKLIEHLVDKFSPIIPPLPQIQLPTENGGLNG